MKRSIVAKTPGSAFGDIEPNLHHAAFQDDVDFMFYCLDKGQTFQDRRGANGLTPVHIAVIYKSYRFLEEAIKTRQMNPWVRDCNLRLPIDIAQAFKDRISMKMLYDWMYEGPFGPRPDAEVMEFPNQGL